MRSLPDLQPNNEPLILNQSQAGRICGGPLSPPRLRSPQLELQAPSLYSQETQSCIQAMQSNTSRAMDPNKPRRCPRATVLSSPPAHGDPPVDVDATADWPWPLAPLSWNLAGGRGGVRRLHWLAVSLFALAHSFSHACGCCEFATAAWAWSTQTPPEDVFCVYVNKAGRRVTEAPRRRRRLTT